LGIFLKHPAVIPTHKPLPASGLLGLLSRRSQTQARLYTMGKRMILKRRHDTEGAMRLLVVFAAVAALASLREVEAQTRGANAPGQSAIRACSVLTRDLVAPLTENKRVLDLIPPEEESMGGSNTACENGAVRLQLYPGRGGKGTVTGKDFQPISGPGWSGYFRDNRGNYAELLVWTAKHSFTLQVSLPSGRSAESLKPDVVALANTIIAKLP
jgi:hypothetical protein